MRETLLALYELQQIDSRSLEFERAAEKFPEKIAELEHGLDGTRSELGALRAEIEAKRREQLEAEGQIRDEGAKAQKWKRRLSEIKTPREYQALSREVEQVERLMRTLEEGVILALEEIETKEKVANELELTLKGAEAEVAGQVRALREKKAVLDRKSREARVGREEVIKRIPPRIYKNYDKTRERRQGVAVALALLGACSGCNFVIRAQMLVQIRKLNSLEICPQCNRLLVLDTLVASAGMVPPQPENHSEPT